MLKSDVRKRIDRLFGPEQLFCSEAPHHCPTYDGEQQSMHLPSVDKSALDSTICAAKTPRRSAERNVSKSEYHQNEEEPTSFERHRITC